MSFARIQYRTYRLPALLRFERRITSESSWSAIVLVCTTAVRAEAYGEKEIDIVQSEYVACLYHQCERVVDVDSRLKLV